MAGESMRAAPAWILRRLDSHERYADRFARQQGDARAIYITD